MKRLLSSIVAMTLVFGLAFSAVGCALPLSSPVGEPAYAATEDDIEALSSTENTDVQESTAEESAEAEAEEAEKEESLSETPESAPEAEDTAEPWQEPEAVPEPESGDDSEQELEPEDESEIEREAETQPDAVTEPEAVQPEETTAPEKIENGEPCTLTAEGEGSVVTATFDETAHIPEGAQLQVTLIDPASERYQARVQEAQKKLSEEAGENEEPSFVMFQLYDIAFVYDGQEIEPAAPVQVSLNFQPQQEVHETENVNIIHFDEEQGPEILENTEVNADQKDGTVTAEFESERFSEYAVVVTSHSNLDAGDYILFFYVNNIPYAINQNGAAVQLDSYSNGRLKIPESVSLSDIIWDISKGNDNGWEYYTIRIYPNGQTFTLFPDTNGSIISNSYWSSVGLDDETISIGSESVPCGYVKAFWSRNGQRSYGPEYIGISNYTLNLATYSNNTSNVSKLKICFAKLQQLTIKVDSSGENNDNKVSVNNGAQSDFTYSSLTSSGATTQSIRAIPGNGYEFDHWELDGTPVPTADGVYVNDNGEGVINDGVYLGNSPPHVLTAVFTPTTSFSVEASPNGHGTVNLNTCRRTRDGYNSEQIVATAQNGYWFNHWEINGETVTADDDFTVTSDGKTCTIPAHGIQVNGGDTLTAVFIPQVSYNVQAVTESGDLVQNTSGCKVKVGDKTPAISLSNNGMTYAGYNTDTITAAAGPGYVFKGWLLDDTPILGDAEITSAADGSGSSIKDHTLKIKTDGVHTVKAVFAQEYHFTVTTSPIQKNADGTVSPIGGTVKDGNSQQGATIYASMTKDGHNKNSITATARSGYAFSHWTMNGQELKNDQNQYLYANGVIPANALTLTSSDDLCAVFLKTTYTITAVASSGGSVDKTSVSTESNNSSTKKATQSITATPSNGYQFAYWKVDAPHDAVVDWGEGCDATSSTITPTVSGDIKLTAMFDNSSNRVFTVTVDDPSHGTVWGKDVSEKNASDDAVGVTTYVSRAKKSGNNYYLNWDVQARTAASGYMFLGWKLYKSDGTLVNSYEWNDTQSKNLLKWKLSGTDVYFSENNMVLEACFGVKTPTLPIEDPALDLTDWADSITATDFTKDKTAKVFDYDNRIYEIDMTASSKKQAIDSSVVINFITDTSRSMYFPANLRIVDTYGNSNQYRAYQLNQWLNGKNTSNVYYIYGNQNKNATLYAIYHNGTQWVWVDASYYEPNAKDGMTQEGTSVTEYNKAATDDDFVIYEQDPTKSAGSRLDYLTTSVEAAVKSIYNICPNAQIDLTTFNRSSTYKGTIPNNDQAIEMMLRNIDVTGGTRQDLGLEEAKKHFTEGSAKRQVAILITDGAPNSGIDGLDEGTIWTNAQSAANELKEIKDAKGNNLELYTMGLSSSYIGTQLGQLATSDDYAKLVKDGTETAETIKQIVNSLLEKVSIFGTVTDTVDPAFYPVDIHGNPIAAGLYAADGSKLTEVPNDHSAYYEWENNNGTWKITWYNQTIAWEDAQHNPGWKKTFYVKAKEDFLGGNKISTNAGNNNGVTATGYVKSDTSVAPLKNNQSVSQTFDYTPYVNVDELHMDGNSTEWTVYLGREVDPKTQLEKLYSKIPVKQVVKNGGTSSDIYITGAGQMWYSHDQDHDDNVDEGPPDGNNQTLSLSHYNDYTSYSDNAGQTRNISEVLAQLLEDLRNGNEVSRTDIVYSEYGHAAGKFTITLTKNVNVEASQDHAPDPHETKVDGPQKETYTLKVQYTPDTNGAKDGTSTGTNYDHTTPGGYSGKKTSGTGNDEVISNNSHIINVLKASLQIRKVDTEGNPITNQNGLSGANPELDSTATFELYRVLTEDETDANQIDLDIAKDQQVKAVKIDTQVTDLNTAEAVFGYLPYTKSHTYYLKETEPPDGYLMREYPIKIELSTESNYTDVNHGAIAGPNDTDPYNQMERVSMLTFNDVDLRVPPFDPNNPILVFRPSVQNTPVYDLPSAGGPGTYFYTIMGTAVGTTSILLFMDDKKRRLWQRLTRRK